MSFVEIADARRMTSAKSQLGTLDWEVDPDGFQRMRLPTSFTLKAVLTLMGRRALEPKLVTALLAVFPARPIERALIAYDVLGGSLLGTDDDELAAQLVAELAPLRGIANESAAVPREQLAALISALQPGVSPGDAATLRAELVADPPNLAALVGFSAHPQHLDADEDAPIREALLAHVRLLAHAHLPSLALAFLQVMFDRFGLPRAEELMIEFALDHDSLASLPQMTGTDDRSMQLQAYLLVRASLAQFDVVRAAKILADLEQHPGVAAASTPSLVLVEGQLVAMQGKRLDLDKEEAVSAIADAALGWRYARSVSDAALMWAIPEVAVSRLESYLTTFGNDPYVWAQATMLEEAKPELAKLLSRELRFCSHDPAVWRALSILTEDDAIDAEVQGHLTTQLRGAMTA